MRSFFVSHGSPTILVENVKWKHFLSQLGERIRNEMQPEVAIVLSPHFVSWDGFHLVETQRSLNCIQDYYGFPQELYRFCYSAENDLDLATSILRLAKESGLPVKEDSSWGLDHGAWIPLMYMFPDGIRAVAISITPGTVEEHIKLGEVISKASEGRRAILLATGSPTHRLDLMYFNVKPHRSKFDSLLIKLLEDGDMQSILSLESTPEWKAAQPEGMLRTLYTAIGASNTGKARVLAYDVPWPGVSMLAAEFED
jgi:Uncharacterized conserved protein